ncbi:MAG: HAMP domain-containing protein, partial [Deltaproteobacteria bacterium]|nr:HAMP domain-containing protein [Deltaproteobacteria bacterium]
MATAEVGPRQWQASLYARAALFLALGAASFVGAIAVLSTATVEESVDRLLSERLELARTVGAFVEARLMRDLDRLSALASAQGTLPATLAAALASERTAGSYNQGAVLLDARGEPVADLPLPTGVPLRDFRLRMLASRANHQAHGLAVSSVLHVGEPPRPALAVVHKLDAPAGSVHFVAGLLALDRGDVMGPLLRAHAKADAVIDLVDARGVVAASTAPNRLALPGDHGEVLAQAIAEQRGLRGRCHGCHGDSRAVTQARVQNVLAFSALPTLSLGIAVLQPERDALAPAFALQRRLMGLGVSFVGLFLIFAGLSVRSVVDPVKRLTRAVRQLDANGVHARLPELGRDEVGELA